MVHRGKGTAGWNHFERQDDDEETLCRRIIDAAGVGHKLGSYACRSIDRRSITIERVEVNRVVYIARKSANNVGCGIIRQNRLPGLVKDIEHVIDGFNDIAVANTESLVRRLDRELVATARVTLLIVIESFKTRVELGIG